MKEWLAELEPVNLNFIAIQDLRVEGERIDDGCAFLAADFGNGTVCLATIDDPVILDKDNKEVKDVKLEIGPHFRIIGMVNGKLVKTDADKLPKLYVWKSKKVENGKHYHQDIDPGIAVYDLEPKNKPEHIVVPPVKAEELKKEMPIDSKEHKFFGNW